MNAIENYRKSLVCQEYSISQTRSKLAKNMTERKIVAFLLSLLILTEVSSLTTALSALNGSILIANSGNITIGSPLHVEGRYIKDNHNNTIVLRGVNQPGFTDSPTGYWRPEGGGIWSGDRSWDPNAVLANLDAMRSWGINVIRGHQSIEWWLQNKSDYQGTPLSQPYIKNLKDTIQLCASRGIYYVFDGYMVRGIGEQAADQDPLPFPPYSLEAQQGLTPLIMPNEQAFVNYWRSVAQELKSFPNVIFEIWNEPHGIASLPKSTFMADWQRVWQECIDAIRSTGATQLIIIQNGFGSYVDLSVMDGDSMNWITTYPLNDSQGNLVYSTHLYRSYGAFHYSIPSWYDAYNYTDMKRGLEWILGGLDSSYPMIVGEIGANMYQTGSNLDQELAFLNNTLAVCNEHGVSYTLWAWTQVAHMAYGIVADGTWIPPPNQAGAILINRINLNPFVFSIGKDQYVYRNNVAYVQQWFPSNITLTVQATGSGFVYLRIFWNYSVPPSVKVQFSSGTVNAQPYFNDTTKLLTIPFSFNATKETVTIYG